VSFAIKRAAKASGRLAVVLKVNGENTLFREKLPDLQCRKWILEPNGQPIVVRGYQRSAQDAEEFRVASPEESRNARRTLDSVFPPTFEQTESLPRAPLLFSRRDVL
jgi:hypothetical protein